MGVILVLFTFMRWYRYSIVSSGETSVLETISHRVVSMKTVILTMWLVTSLLLLAVEGWVIPQYEIMSCLIMTLHSRFAPRVRP